MTARVLNPKTRKSEAVNLCGCGSCPVCLVFDKYERYARQKRLKEKLTAAPLKGPRHNIGYVSPPLARRLAAMDRRSRGKYIRRLAAVRGLPIIRRICKTPAGRLYLREHVETAHIYGYLKRRYPWWSLRIRNSLQAIAMESRRG